jgi:2-oxo-3-hexenedioate decarboxylase/2-keto-4-pentenoate hydratase
MPETAIEAAARIAREHRNRVPFRSLPTACHHDLDYAYAVQDALVGSWLSGGKDTIAGWKIGLTTSRMQQMCGIDQPIAGAILASRVHVSPAKIAAGKFVRLGVEMELAVRIGAPLPRKEKLAPAQILDCVSGVCAAFELIEDRAADYAALDACSLIADNSWNAGIVLGEAIAADRLEGLTGRAGILMRDNETIGRGMTEDAGGDPLQVVGWVAAMLHRRGRRLEADQWVMTGSIVPTRFATPGEFYHFSIDGLPSVEVIID